MGAQPTQDVRSARTGSSGANRVRSLSSDGRTSIASLGAGHHTATLPGAPDAALARAATVGLRRVHHVRIAVTDAGIDCTVSGSTRTLVRRRVPLGAALALADQGVPTFIATGAGA